MSREIFILMITAASVGFIHTLLGPDHYIPFIVLSKARGWSPRKTSFVTAICGVGHVASSVVIGTIGIGIGMAINNLVHIESVRGNIAAWMMIAFGFIYLVWGIKRALKNREHIHLHHHFDGTVHDHPHTHFNDHSHIHDKKSYKELTPWILFTIFVFGPCEPFIPILLYPAARHNFTGIIIVTLTFIIATVGTMVLIVRLSLFGLKFIPVSGFERYLHPISGATILLCGAAIKFMGL